jgi:hypothetical protein
MKLHIVTIALDAMPFLSWHLDNFIKSDTDWHWHIAEGAAMNNHCTQWCQPQEARHSQDGTVEYIDSISDPRVSNVRKEHWDGKLEMFNALLAEIDEPCVLLEVDADEIWMPWQLDAIVALFEECPDYDHAVFDCNYFVGDRIITTTEGQYGHRPGEWIRAWRFEPGMKFLSHEPPRLPRQERGIPKEVTRARELVFNHYAYVSEAQVAYKEHFYGYTNAVQDWKRLQENNEWPVKDLKQYLPWVGDNVEVIKI